MSEMCFDNARVSRMIALGRPKNEILPLFKALVTVIVKTSVSFDPRNLDEEDLIQLGMIKASEVIDKFDITKGTLFNYASNLIRHALWAEAKMKPLDRRRTSDEVDFDAKIDNYEHVPYNVDDGEEMRQNVLKHFRIDKDIKLRTAAAYVVGVFQSNTFDSNRARVLKTLTHGFDVNLKIARHLSDEILIKLRVQAGREVQEVRDDPFFYNKFKYTVIPELRELLKERNFELLIHYFGGITLTIPSKEQLAAIDRDLEILKAMSYDWTCGPGLAKRYNISPEGIKAVFKGCLLKLHTDPEYRFLVSQMMDLNQIPGFINPETGQTKKRVIPKFGEKRVIPKRKIQNTDTMGFQLGTRNSLLYTLIVTGECTRHELVTHVIQKFQGSLEAARATVSAFLSDIKQPFGRMNTSRGLEIITDPDKKLRFTKKSLKTAQEVIEARKRQNLALLDLQPLSTKESA